MAISMQQIRAIREQAEADKARNAAGGGSLRTAADDGEREERLRQTIRQAREKAEKDRKSVAAAGRTETGTRSTGTVSARQARREEEDEEPGGLLGGLMRVMQRNTEINNSRAYRTEEIRQEADRELGQAVANAITPDDPVKALGRAQRSTGLRTVPAERREEIVRESLREDGHTDEEIDAAKTRTPEALYNEYNQWLEEGDNRQRLNDLVQSEQAARKESDIDERMHKLGYTDAEIEEIRTRRQEYEQSVPFGYDITHRIGSSVEGIGSEAVGAAMLIPQTVGTAVGNFFNRRELDTGDESHDELLKAVERVRNSNGMYTLDELAANNDRGWTMQDIQAAAAELDGAKESVDMDSLGGQIYRQGGEKLAEARLGLSDLQELAYGAAESAGENIALGALNPALLLAEQTLRSAGGGIADSAADGMSAGQSLLSGLGHGAVSAGIEQIGIGQMMRNMGMRTGMSGAVDSILDRIAALPGMDRLTPTVAGIVANAGEEAAEEFVQSYADAAVDNLLGSQSAPGLLSGELLGEAAQSALGGAVGGGLIGGISSGIGAVQDVRQGRIAPRADLVANANLSATIEQAGQIGRAQQAAAGTAQAQQEQQAAAQVQQTAPEAVTESATTNPQQRTVDPHLAELAAQSGGRLDASAWRTMQQPQAENAESLTAQDQRRAVRQNWTDEQRAEAMLLEANTSMTEAAVNTAVEAMPADVSGDVYSVAANTVYQLSRQGIAEDWDAALDLASRSGVRVNQILAAPGGAEALQMIYNRGQMDGIEASGYSAAGLADEGRAGQVQYQPGALVPEEDKMLFDLYAAASDTAVTVSDRLEKNAGGYVDTALGKVYFGAEAGADTFGTILHESVHQYNAWDEAGGRELQTATLRYLAEQQGFESVNDLVESYIQRYQEAGQELSYAQACEEITADAMRGVFGSEEAFARWVEHQRALAEQNGRQRSTIAKVMDHVREMLDKVISKAKSILNREPGNAAARQAQALAESQKRALEELYYKHAETAMEAQRAARRSQNQTENVNESEESANENQTGVASSQQNVASSQQNVASSQQNVASEGENVASERMYQLPEDTGNKADNIRILSKADASEASIDDAAKRYHLPVDEGQMESGQRAAAVENMDVAGLADYLSELYSNGEVRRVPVENVQRLARKFIREYGSKANEITIAKQIDGLLNYMATGQADYRIVRQVAEGIADTILRSSTRRDYTLWNQYKDLHYFTVKVERGGMEQRELISKYGSYEIAKKELAKFGIKVTTGTKDNPRHIDQVYQELSNDYPGWFRSDVTDPMAQLDRIAEVRHSIQPIIVNNFAESYDETVADVTVQLIGAAVGEGVTDTGIAGMLRQRINESLNAHRAGIQQRVQDALNEQARTARNESFRQAQRIVKTAGEANQQRMERERKEWAETSNEMRRALARSKGVAQRARDAREADVVRRQIATARTKLTRMLLHPNDQYHVPPQWIQTAIDIAELANHYTYNNQAVKKLQALRTQLEDLAKTDDGVDGISSDWENSGIKEMLESLTTGMERVSSTRLQKQADAQARRMQSGQQVLDAQREAVENMGLGDRKLFNFTLDELRTLRDATRAMVTLIQNSNKLVATQTAQSAAEFASVATQEVATSKYRLGDRRNVFKSLLNNWRANFNNAERMLMVMGGYRHGGAMETLSKSLSEGEAKKTSIREKGLQLFENVLKGKENEKKLRKFSGVDAELIDIGLVFDGDGKAAKINRAQAAGVYLHLQNEQNRNHLLKGGVVIPDMSAYIKGDIKNAYRLTRTAHIKDAGQTLGALEKMLEEDEYFRQWVDDAKEFFNVYTRNIINETSRRLNGYDKATVENYYPLTVDPDVLQQEIEGLVHNGTIEGRGFLKPRQQRAAQPILLEELDRVMVRSLADTAAYGGLAPAIRDANKILNANRTEGGSLWKVIGTAFGDEGKKFMKDYLTDLQQQPRGRKSIYDFLGGLRGNYAGAVLTLNLATAAGQISGVPAAASELGADATWEAFKFMKKQKAETLEALRKEMTDHGYWQLESTLSTGATAELAELRQKRGLVKAVAERVPGVNLLEHMDMKTRLALWVGSKYYVDHNLEEFGLTEADVQGEKRSDAWWDAVVAKMTQANDRTQPNYTVSQQAAIQRNPDQLVKTLVMFKSQSFQNFQIVTSAIEDYFAQKDYVEEAAKKLADTSLDAEGRQQAQADLERAQAERQTAGVRLKQALASQAVSSAVYVAVTLLIKDVLLHRYDRDKDKNGQITPASVAGRFGWEFVSNLMENIPFVDIGINILSGDDDPIDLSGIDSIGDAVSDLKQIVSDIMNEDRTSEDEEDRANYWSNLKEQAFDTVTSLLNLAGVPFGQVQRWVEGINGWIDDISTAANSDGLNLWDVMNAPPSSASQYDRLYTAVFEEPDPEDAAAALKRLADLDKLTPPAKASDAKAGDSKMLTELLKREREYGTSVQDAAAARVAGDEDQQRQIRQELVNTLADALGIDQSTKEGQRRLRTVINKVDSAITDEVREQMGADSKTGATVYTPLLAALEDGGDLTAAQTVLRRAGITDSDIKSAVQSVYKDEYLWADDAGRQEIETKLLRLKDAYGEPYFTKTKDQDDFADWVTDWTLQGLNDSVYTDLDEALLTEDRVAAQQEINRYMEAGKEIGSIRNRVSSLYKREYQNADAARRRELGRFLAGLVAGGEQVVTTDTLLDWIKESYR